MPPQGDIRTYPSIIEPWYRSLEDPAEAQGQVLDDLIKKYTKTQYGKDRNIDEVDGVEAFRERFPIMDYQRLEGYLKEVKGGNYEAILSEPPQCWVMTRGSTGTSKVLPATRTHLGQILSCGARAVVNYVHRNDDMELARGKFLNLSMPSRVATFNVDRNSSYGYSSGTYSRIFPSLGGTKLVPTQVEIDSLGPGITKRDWERRFDLIYDTAKEENVTAAIGVAPVILSFARYVKKVHRKKPRDLWGIRAVFATSVRKIQIRYAALFRKYLGEAPTIEIYSATEGVFAQQLDGLPYVTPNYDKFLFEVETHGKFRMLHELRRGEWGRLIISTCMFPRYDIGDMIEAEGKNYFRVFGRARAQYILEHRLHRLLFGWLL